MNAIATWIVAVSQAAAAAVSPPAAPPPEAVAPGVELLRGAILPQRRHPAACPRTQAARRRDPEHALASRPLERQRPRQGLVPGCAGLHDRCGGPRAGRGRLPDAQPRILEGDARRP